MNLKWKITILIIAITIMFCALIVVPIVAPSGPSVVVNMPEGGTPLAEYTNHPSVGTNTISGERAILWWTVYSKTLDKTGYIESSKEAANDAVRATYGDK